MLCACEFLCIAGVVRVAGELSSRILVVQNKNSEFCAPLTSFDWNETDLNRLGTSSIDTTCTIWDIEVTHFLCHERKMVIPGR